MFRRIFIFLSFVGTFCSFIYASPNDNNVTWSGLRHDTFDNFYRSPFGAVTVGSPVTIRFRTLRNDVTNVFLRVYELDPTTGNTVGPNDQPLAVASSDSTYDFWQINFAAPVSPKLFYYKFRVVDGTDEDFYSDEHLGDHDNLNQGGVGAPADNEPFHAFQLTVYKADFSTPGWLHNSAVYQIFVDRFRNGDVSNDWCRAGSTSGCPSLYGASPAANITHTNWNELMVDPRATGNNNAYGSQFYGGDLNGVREKLDYIKSLGINTIYLNPVFSARSNHGYDTDNFLEIAPQIGGDAAFDSLIAAANARGIKIILDGVWNHVSQDSLYMDYFHRYPELGGCESFASSYRSWFSWNATATTVPCVTSHYVGWFGFGGLPELTEIDAVRNFIYRDPINNVTKKWLDRGASGWRFDVADNISNNWWTEYRDYARSYKSDAPLIGEVWPDASRYLAGNQLDGVMNYRFRKNVLGFARGFDWLDNDNNGTNSIIGLTPSQFNLSMKSIREDYPLPAQLSMLNLLDSHDTNRALYVLKNTTETQSDAKERLKLAALFQFTYLGAPMVYYGDEVAINSPSLGSGGGLPEDDPYNRAPYPWSDENGNQNAYGPADAGVKNFYATLGLIRKAFISLRIGTFEELLTGDTTPSATDDNSFAFARVLQSEKVIVAMNNGVVANTVAIPVSAYFADGQRLRDYLGIASGQVTYFTVSGGNVVVTLPPRSGVILTIAGQPGATAVINGRISFASGSGVRRVRMTLRNETNGSIQKVQTDGDGNYRFSNIAAGDIYTIVPELRFHSFTPIEATVAGTGDLNSANFSARRNTF